MYYRKIVLVHECVYHFLGSKEDSRLSQADVKTEYCSYMIPVLHAWKCASRFFSLTGFASLREEQYEHAQEPHTIQVGRDGGVPFRAEALLRGEKRWKKCGQNVLCWI